MTLWDVLLLWLVARLMGGKTAGPQWQGPTGPTGPTGQGATGPIGPTGPSPGGTTWNPYFYIQPDAGASLGTPYALAAEWHGKGTAWSEMYNFTKDRTLGGALGKGINVQDSVLSYNWPFGKKACPMGGDMEARTVVVHLSSSDEVWVSPDDQAYIAKCIAKEAYSGDDLNAQRAMVAAKLRAAKAAGAPYGTVVVGAEHGANVADVGDKLLIPWTWPEPKHASIKGRLEPIPAGTSLPGVASTRIVQGDEDVGTI